MRNVVIVDDEPWARQVVKALGQWDRLGLSVAGEAEDGKEGIHLIEGLGPDIVITDMRMPGLEGTELLKEMNGRFPSLKIIVMSGYDDFVYLQQAIRSRAVEYLLKPVDPDQLNAALDRCVRELEEAEAASRPWSSSFAFDDRSVLQAYLEYRRLINGYLLDLNKTAVLQTFDKLAVLLSGAQAGSDAGLLNKVSHDFVLMLEEFAAGQEGLERLSGTGERAKNRLAGWSSPDRMLGGMGQLFAETIDAVEKARRSRGRLDLAGVKAHIDRHFLEPISLEQLSQHFYISKEHLSRAFKTHTGENLMDYIQRKRMEKAKELIADHKMAIKHAAQMTGYEDVAYFYRVFKRHFGMTPGELRREE